MSQEQFIAKSILALLNGTGPHIGVAAELFTAYAMANQTPNIPADVIMNLRMAVVEVDRARDALNKLLSKGE